MSEQIKFLLIFGLDEINIFTHTQVTEMRIVIVNFRINEALFQLFFFIITKLSFVVEIFCLKLN